MLDASRRMFYELAKKQRKAYEHERGSIYVRKYICIWLGFSPEVRNFTTLRAETVDIYSDVT